MLLYSIVILRQYNTMPFVAVLNHSHNAARLRITEAMCTLSLLVFCIRELRFSPQKPIYPNFNFDQENH